MPLSPMASHGKRVNAADHLLIANVNPLATTICGDPDSVTGAARAYCGGLI